MYHGCTVTKTSHLPIRYLLALLWAHPILHISTIRVNNRTIIYNLNDNTVYPRRKWAQCLSRTNYARFADAVYEETWSTKEMVKTSVPMKMEQARNWLKSCWRRWAVETTYTCTYTYLWCMSFLRRWMWRCSLMRRHVFWYRHKRFGGTCPYFLK